MRIPARKSGVLTVPGDPAKATCAPPKEPAQAANCAALTGRKSGCRRRLELVYDPVQISLLRHWPAIAVDLRRARTLMADSLYTNDRCREGRIR